MYFKIFVAGTVEMPSLLSRLMMMLRSIWMPSTLHYLGNMEMEMYQILLSAHQGHQKSLEHSGSYTREYNKESKTSFLRKEFGCYYCTA